jgi:hypothetical protein
MMRSHIKSSRSYPGRSVFHAVKLVSSEITGGVPVLKISRHRQGVSCPVCEIRNKEGRQETS